MPALNPAAKRSLLLLLLFAWCLLLRAPTFVRSVIDWDESIYVLVASQWLEGHLPYSTVFDHKPVGIYAIFATTLAVFGESMASIRLTTTAFVFLTSVALFFLARRLSGNTTSAVLAAVCYPVFSLGLQGLSSNTELFFICLNVSGLLFLVEATSRPARTRYLFAFLAGLFFGAAVQTKYVVVIEIAFFLVYLVAANHRQFRPIPAFAAALAAGLLLPTIAIVAYFAAADAFTQFYASNFEANRRYLVAGNLSDYWNGFRHSSQDWIKWNWVTVLAILLTGRATQREAGGIHTQRFLFLWLVFAFLESWSTLKFFKHYFLVTIPPLCLLLAHRLGHYRISGNRKTFAAILGIVLLFPIVRTTDKYYQPWIASYLELGDANVNIARHVRDRIGPDDYIYVVNGQPIVYFLSGARMPTRYVLPPNIISESFSRVINVDYRAELDRIFANKPRVVLIRQTTEDNPRVEEIRQRVAKNYAIDTQIGDTLIYLRRE